MPFNSELTVDETNHSGMLRKEDLPLVLDADDIREILRIGRRQTYELLSDPPFHVERVGKRGVIRVSRDSFFKWLEGSKD